MVNILVEKDGEILRFPTSKFITPELDAKLVAFNSSIAESMEEVEEEVEVSESLKKYTFKNSEVFVSGNLELNHVEKRKAITVTVHKPNVNIKVDYELQHEALYNPMIESLYHNLGINYTNSDEKRAFRKSLDKHLKFNRYKFSYKNRDGLYYTAMFKDKNKTSSLHSDYIFEVKRTDLVKFGGGGSINMTHAKRPVLNNIYPQKTICWGRVTKSPILTSSKTVFEASERMLNFFLGSTFNRDLSSSIAVDTESFTLAIKRNFNEEKVTGLTNEEYEATRKFMLSLLSGFGSRFSMLNITLLAVMSVLDLDFSDLEYSMGE